MLSIRSMGFLYGRARASFFLIMGLIIILVILFTYYIGVHYIAPEMLIIILAISTIFLLVVAQTITSSFERMAKVIQMKSEFVSIVSHQLRTPLSSLKWSLGLFRTGRLGKYNKKQEEYINIINESNNRMIDLVNDLLNVNRIEQKKLVMEPKSFSINSLIDEMIKELKPLAQKNEVVVNFNKGKNLPLVYADSNRIRMVIQNLIDNAIKYSKKDGDDRWVEIITEKNRNQVKFSVSDNGVGIPSNLQGKMFEKFSRGDHLIRQRVEGAGLGLFIAKGIIKLSGREIGFKSKKGKGSTFWFTLPIANKHK